MRIIKNGKPTIKLDSIPGPVGLLRAIDKGKIALILNPDRPLSNHAIQLTNATHDTAETVSVATMTGLLHAYSWDPACCKANTRRTVAMSRRRAPRTSIWAREVERRFLRSACAGQATRMRPTPSTAAGALKRYIHLHVELCVMTPPRMGPRT